MVLELTSCDLDDLSNLKSLDQSITGANAVCSGAFYERDASKWCEQIRFSLRLGGLCGKDSLLKILKQCAKD